MMADGTARRVVRAQSCELTVTDRPWPFADAHSGEIETHWARRHAENPAFFNGTVYLLREHTFSGGAFRGVVSPVPFASFLYWREQGHPDQSVRIGFGSAVLRSAEGHVLLGRQSPGNLNAGLAYPPSGFLDPRDARPDGSIDVDAGILRELDEETGVSAGDVSRHPGYRIVMVGLQVSLAVEFRSGVGAEALRASILARIAGDQAAELRDIVIVRTLADTSDAGIADYARVLLGDVLGAAD